jgi:hypothetical protein
VIILGADGKVADWEETTEPGALVLVWDSDHLKGQHLKLVKRSEAGDRQPYEAPFFPPEP